MITRLAVYPKQQEVAPPLIPCEHRTVSKDGRIVCGKIVEGEAVVTAEVCRGCPYQAVNCRHLRFALRQRAARPLVVRYNGRTEVWNDEPVGVEFDRAACAEKVVPVEGAAGCVGCVLREAVTEAGAVPAPRQRVGAGPCPAAAWAGGPGERMREGEPSVPGCGKVVPFRGRGVVAATG